MRNQIALLLGMVLSACGPLGVDEDVASDSQTLVRARVLHAGGAVIAEGCELLVDDAAFRKERRLLVVPFVANQQLTASFLFERVHKRNADLPDDAYENRPASFWCGTEDDQNRGAYHVQGFGCLSSSTNPSVAEVTEITSDARSDHAVTQFSVLMRAVGRGIVTVTGRAGCAGEGDEFAILTLE